MLPVSARATTVPAIQLDRVRIGADATAIKAAIGGRALGHYGGQVVRRCDEVLRGPAVLLYGSQAIGGAVNVIDKRIPTRVPDEAVHLDAFAGRREAHGRDPGADGDPLAFQDLALDRALDDGVFILDSAGGARCHGIPSVRGRR